MTARYRAANVRCRTDRLAFPDYAGIVSKPVDIGIGESNCPVLQSLAVGTVGHALRQKCNPKEIVMQAWVAPLRLFAYVVVALMLAAIVYAGFISIKYWSGIGV